jgi:subtilase family serine protease
MKVRCTSRLALGSVIVVSMTVMSAGGLAASVGSSVATATPLLRVVSSTHYAAPPTTEQCVADIGLACYTPAQFQTAYDMNPLYAKGLDGAGKTIVLVDSYGSPTIGADLATFDKAFHLPAPPSFRILQPEGPVPPFNASDPTMVSWAEETSLDVEYSHAMAPGANILLVETPVAETEGVAGFPQMIAAENYVINKHLGDVISQSFGATEETFPTEQSLMNLRSAYVNAAAHDVTVLAAAGDTGVTGYRNAAGTLLYDYRAVDWPSSDPLVTSVGGTQLHLNAAGGRLLPDNVWNDTNELGSPAAGSGGVSEYFGRPGYQNPEQSVVGAHRGTPDVALSAAVDGAALVYLGFLPTPAFYLIGGTSEASPLFSGVVAIADQAAGHDLGLLNGALYSLAASGAPGLQDITTGNNSVTFSQNGVTHTVKGYLAGPGYDLASGLGTVDGAMLVSELSAKTG